jgi:RNA polymerase sigma-70 factor (ECF subfamily)
MERDIQADLERGELKAAAERGIRTYGPEIYGYLVSVLRDDALASEAFSALGEDLWRGLPSFRRECSFRTWAYKLAWHAAARVLRDPFLRRGRRLDTEELSRVVEEVRTATAAYLRTSARDQLERLRTSLEPEEQTLLTLRLDRKMSWKEIAVVLSTAEAPVTEQTLWKRFERLKAKIRKLTSDADPA